MYGVVNLLAFLIVAMTMLIGQWQFILKRQYVLPLIPAVLYVTGMLPTAILSARGFQMHANTAAKQRGLAIALKPRHLNHNMNGKLSEVYNLLEYNIFEGCKLF